MASGPRYIVRYAKEEKEKMIGEFSSLRDVYNWACGEGCPASWLEVGVWDGSKTEWLNLGRLVIR